MVNGNNLFAVVRSFPALPGRAAPGERVNALYLIENPMLARPG